MNGTHPAAELLDRYRQRIATPAETVAVDAHVASCDRCFDAVRADAHLTYDQLEALADGRVTTSPHLSLCSVCRGEVEDLRQMRDALVEEPRTWRRWWLLAAAAMLAIALAAGLLLFRGTPGGAPDVIPASDAEQAPTETAAKPKERQAVVLERPAILDTLITERSVLRGGAGSGAFALQAPVATVVLDATPRFAWTALAGATSYEVAVVDLERGNVVATGASASTSWQPAEALPRGRTYAWQVTAITGSERAIAPGRDAAEARFHVSTQTAVDRATPVERGIALAVLGALDDAERELASAGASELLQQLRSWR